MLESASAALQFVEQVDKLPRAEHLAVMELGPGSKQFAQALPAATQIAKRAIVVSMAASFMVVGLEEKKSKTGSVENSHVGREGDSFLYVFGKREQNA